MYTNPSFNEEFLPKATLMQITIGRSTDWYLHDNADEIISEALGGNGPYTDRQLMYVNGWFAEYGWFDDYADYRQDAWTGEVVSGPYATEEEAFEAAEQFIAANYPEYFNPDSPYYYSANNYGMRY